MTCSTRNSMDVPQKSLWAFEGISVMGTGPQEVALPSPPLSGWRPCSEDRGSALYSHSEPPASGGNKPSKVWAKALSGHVQEELKGTN